MISISLALIASLSAVAARSEDGSIKEPDVSFRFFEYLDSPPPSGDSIRFFVDPKGVVVSCQTVAGRTRGEDGCRTAIGRKFGKPAETAQGEKVYGFSQLSRFPEGKDPPRNPNAGRPDLEIFVSGLPSGETRTGLNMLALIDPKGAVQDCGFTGEIDRQLSSVACSQARSHIFPAAKTPDGVSVLHVRWLFIQFVDASEN